MSNISTYRGSKRTIFTFYSHRSVKQAVIIAWLAAISAATSLIGFVNAYPTAQSRQFLETSFGNNVGLKLLLGIPHEIGTVGGFVAWRTSGILVLIGSIWAMMLATKLFRGEEQSGRTELMLAGQTTARRASMQLLAVIIVLLMLIFVILLAATFASARYKSIDFSLAQVGFFAFSGILSMAVFASIGSLASQFFATRAQALRASAIIFAIFFMMRGLGASTNNLHWIADISPIGWIENLHPLTGSEWIWVLPILCLITITSITACWLAGKRDLGSSIIRDNDTAQPKTTLLGSTFGLSLRLMRPSLFGWFIGLGIGSFVFGTVAKSAGDAFSSSSALQNVLSHITMSSKVGTEAFFGMIFLILILAILMMTAGMVSGFREEEAEGYVDNILVRPIARIGLFRDKAVLIVCAIILASFIAALAGWLGAISQHADVSIFKILLAAINMVATGMLLLGIGLFMYGFLPRATAAVLYSLIGWAFLVEIIGSVINLNHWILDSSILHHVPLVPAVEMNWNITVIFIILGCILAVSGGLRFTKRDIQTN